VASSDASGGTRQTQQRRSRRAAKRSAPARGLFLGWRAPAARPAGFGFGADLRTQDDDPTAPLLYDGELHAATVAPTGAGKGVGCIIPNLLHYPGPVIVVDPKGEAAQVTAKWREKMGQRVIILDPFGVLPDRQSDRLNPFDLFDLAQVAVEDEARTLADLLTGGVVSLQDPFWDTTSQAFLAGFIAHVATAQGDQKRAFSVIRDHFGSGDLEYLLETWLESDQVFNDDARQEFAIFLQHPEKGTRPSVQSSAQQHLRSFGSRAIRAVTDDSSFSLKDLIAGEPMTIYIVMPPSKIVPFSNVLRLWLGVILAALSTRTRLPEQRTLLMIDEAAQLGHMRLLEQAITLFRGYGLLVWTFWQDLSQLQTLYPNSWKTILNNCGVLQTFGLRNYQAARDFCDFLGNLDPMRLLTLDKRDQVLLGEDGVPQIARRSNYLTDQRFKGLYAVNQLYDEPER